MYSYTHSFICLLTYAVTRLLSYSLTHLLTRKSFGNILLKKKKLLGHMHWIGNEVETSEALEVAGICTNKGRLSFEGAMLL